MSFYYQGDTRNGILKYLYDKYTNKDEYYKQVLTHATSCAGDPKFAIDFNFDKYWHAVDFDKIGNYIVIYLKDYYINIKGFALTSSKHGANTGSCHPKNWGFDASNNNDTWENQVNYTDANNNMFRPYASGYFGWDYGTYKYFRFMITGEQYDGQEKYSIDLNQIEFFGDLIPNNELHNIMHSKCFECKNYHLPSSFLFISLFL